MTKRLAFITTFLSVLGRDAKGREGLSVQTSAYHSLSKGEGIAGATTLRSYSVAVKVQSQFRQVLGEILGSAIFALLLQSVRDCLPQSSNK